jgi:hypothetical protein
MFAKRSNEIHRRKSFGAQFSGGSFQAQTWRSLEERIDVLWLLLRANEREFEGQDRCTVRTPCPLLADISNLAPAPCRRCENSVDPRLLRIAVIRRTALVCSPPNENCQRRAREIGEKPTTSYRFRHSCLLPVCDAY